MIWISVEDSLPPVRQRVLAYNAMDEAVELVCYIPEDSDAKRVKNWGHLHGITHWMVLPDAPAYSVVMRD